MAGGRRRLRWVVKVGGSLSKSGVLSKTLAAIDRLTNDGFHIVVAPGGGQYADFIRTHSARRGLDDKTSHLQAILAVQQFGLELACKLKTGAAVTSIRETDKALSTGATAVFLPSPGLVISSGAPERWDTTSDAIAATLCRRLKFGGLILLKSVDGVAPNGRLIETATATAASRAGVVDPVFPRTVGKDWDVFIINGARPARLEALLRTGHLTGTRLRQ